MSASAYYNFITAEKNIPFRGDKLVIDSTSSAHSIEAHRQTALSPSSSNSNSSLYQFNSLTPTSTASSSSSSSSSSASSTNIGVNHLDLSRQSSVTTTTTRHHECRLFHSYTLHSLEPKPLKPFKTSSDYLEAMKEDLAEWFNRLYADLDLTTENFFPQLETGSIICRHANNVTKMGRNLMLEQASLSETEDSFLEKNNNNSPSPPNDSSLHYINSNQSLSLTGTSSSFKSDRAINWFRVKMIPFRRDSCPGTFFARDNICQFILWCRSLNILECLLFETDDLVARKNEKSFILCLLEVARIGFKVGMPTPLIIQLEQEIDREIENDAKLQKQFEETQDQHNGTIDSFGIDVDDCDGEVELNKVESQINKQDAIEEKETVVLDEPKVEEEKEVVEEEEESGSKPQVITNDLLSLHEKVVQLLCLCTCPTQFPMVRVGDNGKYKVGDKLIIFVRILRRHIMVRVGGGWQELSEFLRVKDPCRSRLCPPQTHHQIKLGPSSFVSKARMIESSQHSNKSHNHYRTVTGGQRLISGSASMSWLSHN